MATSHREGVPCPLRHASGPPAEAVSGDRAGSTGVNLKGGGFRRAREAEIQTRDADPGRAGAESHQPVCAPRTRASILTGEGGDVGGRGVGGRGPCREPSQSCCPGVVPSPPGREHPPAPRGRSSLGGQTGPGTSRPCTHSDTRPVGPPRTRPHPQRGGGSGPGKAASGTGGPHGARAAERGTPEGRPQAGMGTGWQAALSGFRALHVGAQ